MNWKKKMKNPYFWFGLIGVIFTAAQVDMQTLTSWVLLKESIVSVAKNPMLLGSVIVAVTGVIMNPNTKGFKD